MEGTFSDDTFRFVSPDACIVLFGDLCVAMRLSAVHQKHYHQEYKYCQQFGHRLMTVSLLCVSETRKAQQIHDPIQKRVSFYRTPSSQTFCATSTNQPTYFNLMSHLKYIIIRKVFFIQFLHLPCRYDTFSPSNEVISVVCRDWSLLSKITRL